MIEENYHYPNKFIEQLKSSWFNLLERASANLDLGNDYFAFLANSYSDKDRIYHNLDHIWDILSLIEQIKSSCINTNALYFSAWFHDCIYNPKAQDNEIKSAVIATNILKQLNIKSITIETVEQIILSTKYHKPLLDNIDNLFFLDIDLSILGAPFRKYLKYAQAIRQEYNHLSDRDYYQGRKKVLTQFLARERIYYTDFFYLRLELKARSNIKQEINCL